jgi:hypothetical protein
MHNLAYYQSFVDSTVFVGKRSADTQFFAQFFPSLSVNIFADIFNQYLRPSTFFNPSISENDLKTEKKTILTSHVIKPIFLV